jgi:parallel beta-helix repeat protein
LLFSAVRRGRWKATPVATTAITGLLRTEQSRLVARNNTCEGNKYSGIALFGSAQGEVEGNTCRNNGYHGIYADEQSRLVARNNTCEGNKLYSGIALFGSAQGEVEVATALTCRNNSYHGISLFGSAAT